MLDRHMNAVLVELDHTSGMDRLLDKRIVRVSCRGVALKVHVKCIHKQVELMFWAAIREAAVEMHVLLPLMCENELAQECVAAPTATIGAGLVAAAAAARSTCNRTLVAKDQKDGPSVKADLMKQEVALSATGASFQIEVQFSKEMVGAGGEAALQAKVLEGLRGRGAPTCSGSQGQVRTASSSRSPGSSKRS